MYESTCFIVCVRMKTIYDDKVFSDVKRESIDGMYLQTIAPNTCMYCKIMIMHIASDKVCLYSLWDI